MLFFILKISLKFFVCQVAHMIFSAETDRQLVEHAYNKRNFIFMLIAFGIYILDQINSIVLQRKLNYESLLCKNPVYN